MTNLVDVLHVRGTRCWNWTQGAGFLYLHDNIVEYSNRKLIFRICEMRFMSSNDVCDALDIGVTAL